MNDPDRVAIPEAHLSFYYSTLSALNRLGDGTWFDRSTRQLIRAVYRTYFLESQNTFAWRLRLSKALGKYFKKQMNLKQFGVSELADFVKLVKVGTLPEHSQHWPSIAQHQFARQVMQSGHRGCQRGWDNGHSLLLHFCLQVLRWYACQDSKMFSTILDDELESIDMLVKFTEAIMP